MPDNTMIEGRSPRISPRLRRRGIVGAAAAALLALGGVAGAVVAAESRPAVSMAPAVPVAIRSLSSTGIVTIRGQVAEVFGNKFVLADPTGRALVDTGREGEEHALVTVGAPVTVQGRFDHGFVHAAFLVGADSKVTALGPLMGPPHHHEGPGGPHGPGPDGPGPDGPHGPRPGGPDRLADGPGAPPPPPPAAGAPAPAPVTAPAPAANAAG